MPIDKVTLFDENIQRVRVAVKAKELRRDGIMRLNFGFEKRLLIALCVATIVTFVCMTKK